VTLFDDGHLRDRAAALVDGELGHDARERALGHLARCIGCRAEVEQQRRLKIRVGGLPAPQPPLELTARLAAIPVTGVPPRTDAGADGVGTGTPGAVFGAGRVLAHPVPVDRRRATRAGRSTLRSSRVGRLVAGGTGLVAAGLTAVAVLGGDGTGTGPVDPAGEYFVMEHAVVTGELPLTDSAVGAAVSVSLHR